MNIEELRAYCLSLGEVEEKFPFSRFNGGKDILVFYVGGYMYCYLDIKNLTAVNMKADKTEIPALKEQYDVVSDPYHASAKYWIGVDATRCPDDLLKKLIKESFDIVLKKSIRHPKVRK